MAYSEVVLQRARQRLAQEKAQYDAKAEARRAQIYQEYPRLLEIDRALRQSVAAAVAAAFRRGENPAQAIEGNQGQKSRPPAGAGMAAGGRRFGRIRPGAAALLPPLRRQRLCGRGDVRMSAGYLRDEQKKELSSLLSGKESFDGFRLDLYPAEPDPTLGVSPRELMERTFQRCKRYARTFHPGARRCCSPAVPAWVRPISRPVSPGPWPTTASRWSMTPPASSSPTSRP